MLTTTTFSPLPRARRLVVADARAHDHLESFERFHHAPGDRGRRHDERVSRVRSITFRRIADERHGLHRGGTRSSAFGTGIVPPRPWMTYT
jgi:hypothetical protein